MTTLNDTPSSNRIHIGFFGKRNSGKSSLINAFTNQDVSIVSEFAGTTTDNVNKPMEIHGIGPCVLIDTAGFDDEGELGSLRIEKTELAAEKTDIAVILFSGSDLKTEFKYYQYFKEKHTPVLCVVSRSDMIDYAQGLKSLINDQIHEEAIIVSINDADSLTRFKDALISKVPENYGVASICGHLVGENDLVMLVMPQDIQAPQGRLILPQVQVTRDLLDLKCLIISVTADKFQEGLAKLKQPPKLIITDSQCFKMIYQQKPKASKLTSFSILFADYKGDLNYYIRSAEAIEKLNENSKVLIAEACTHAPLAEDIGRVKIPRLLKQKVGPGLQVDLVAGNDFPLDLSSYDLIIQCGACMFNAKYVMNRIERAKEQGIPMSNYGVVLAYLNGILDKISV